MASLSPAGSDKRGSGEKTVLLLPDIVLILISSLFQFLKFQLYFFSFRE
jgi:hypothetical protein